LFKEKLLDFNQSVCITRRFVSGLSTTSIYTFQKFGATEYEVEAAILNGDPMDQLVIAYNLIIDNKRIVDNSMFWFITSISMCL